MVKIISGKIARESRNQKMPSKNSKGILVEYTRVGATLPGYQIAWLPLGGSPLLCKVSHLCFSNQAELPIITILGRKCGAAT